MIAVYLVDDHRIVREGLRALIDAQPDMHVVGDADNGRSLAGPVLASGADIVVIDVSMPGTSGPAATADLKDKAPRVKVLALTRHTEEAYVHEMLRSGASGYVLKQNGAGTLVEAIRAVVRGGTFLDPVIGGKLVQRLTTEPDGSRGDAALTSREQQIATMVAYGHTNKEIATKLDITVKTVETHKSNIMAKLHLTSRSALVQYALEHGWLERSGGDQGIP